MQKKHGFTLVELLIVIAIIGLLATIVAPRLANAMTGAKEQHCRNNLRQLHSAVIDFAADQGGNLPFAQSYEVYDVHNNAYYERRGWVTWAPDNNKPKIEKLDAMWSGDKRHESQSGNLYDDLGVSGSGVGLFAVENGTLFDYVGDPKFYVCPVQSASSTNRANKMTRTYSMNPYFGSPSRKLWDPVKITHVGVSQSYGKHVPEADKLLLFSEICPAANGNSEIKRDGFNDNARGSAHASDCGIDPSAFDDVSYSSSGRPQCQIAYGPHSGTVSYGGRKLTSALAVFFDGHIEKILPVVETETGSGTGVKANTVWFLNRGLRPSDSDPTM